MKRQSRRFVIAALTLNCTLIASTRANMSYELESKKRKFHRILDSISKPQQAGRTPTPAPAPPMTARERVTANLSIKKVRLSSKDRSELASKRNSSSESSNVYVSSNKRPTLFPWVEIEIQKLKWQRWLLESNRKCEPCV
ncbi:hypothetical protein N7522_009994 [Penicillium canescens]|nr:hypothetical protein N7522_009994 [Penicillium canescens]